jgi:hypothetical protein
VAAQAGADSLLFERLRQALAPEHVLEREIARGGMGIVFLARDRTLDRPVAVKLLVPGHATAELAARFLREAKVLARLRHPYIVTVHQVGERAGLFYYIMEWLDGETLQDRLRRGPLPLSQVHHLGSDVLDALGTAHRQKWVHRDVKPGNIFLTDGRAVLTDFGIAHPLDDDGGTTLTETRQLLGTLAYMSPEQREGGPVTEASDIYSTGLVLYEAVTGRRWWQREHEANDWTGVPAPLRNVLRKAMQRNPADRWDSAARFRAALLRPPSRMAGRFMNGAAIALLAVVLYLWFRPKPPPPPRGHEVRIQAIESREPGGWGDSIGAVLATTLASFPDLAVSGPFPRQAEALRGPGLVLAGALERQGDQLQATMESRPGSGSQIRVAVEGRTQDWRTLADSLANRLIYAIYLSDTTQDPTLPTAALPRTAAGRRAWIAAERLFTQGGWGEAAAAYRTAEATDSTCLLCSFRINDIDRWLDQPHDPSRLQRLTAHMADFPVHYRLLIQAASTRWPERIVLMDSATRTRDFFLAFFHKGDEIFHRGPHFGQRRREAMDEFERTAALKPDFAPAWEHLAWLRIAEGDSAGAAHALDSLEQSGKVNDQISLGLRFLLQAAFDYRFGAPGTGEAVIQRALRLPEISNYPYLAMAPRLMLTFDAPGAAIRMGRIFARRSASAEVGSGLLAQAFGYLVRGDPDTALYYARQLRARIPGIESDLFAAQLAGTIALVEEDSFSDLGERRATAQAGLRRYVLPHAAREEARRRAAWLLALLARRTRTASDETLALQVLGRGSSDIERDYLALLQADQLAARGLYQRALDLTDWRGDDLVRLPDPFLSSVTHFFRAEWFARLGNTQAALSTLLWHEANDFVTYPQGEAQAMEVNLAFGTLARWKQARLLDRAGPDAGEACHGYRAVARLWRLGNPEHRARAGIAEQRLAALGCGTE